MIISIAPAGPSWIRRAAVVLACAGLAALLASWLHVEAPPLSNAVAPPVLVGQREVTRPPSSDASREAPTTWGAPRRSVEVARPVVPSNAQLPTVPFRFLGKLDVDGATSVVLYGRGRTLTVRGPGPLDEDYVIDAMEEGYLMLRHVASGTSQRLELASRQPTTIPAGSVAEAPLD